MSQREPAAALPEEAEASLSRCNFAVAPDALIYAIGDIHGRADLLKRLLDKIAADCVRQDPKLRTTLVFLGDYVDRGEESRAVIDALLTLRDAGSFDSVFLKGNHEDALLNFLDEPERGRSWLRFGGLQTLASYGVAVRPDAVRKPGALSEVRDRFRDKLRDHEAFLRDGLATSYQSQDVYFCHAGINPLRPIAQQRQHELMWGAPGFDTADLEETEVRVVHGHFIRDDAEITGRRVSLDTGAYYSGNLSAARFRGADTFVIDTLDA